MQGRAFGARHIPQRNGREKIRLALDRGRPRALGQVLHGRERAERIGQRHHGAAMEHSRPRAQVLAHLELGLYPLGGDAANLDTQQVRKRQRSQFHRASPLKKRAGSMPCSLFLM